MIKDKNNPRNPKNLKKDQKKKTNKQQNPAHKHIIMTQNRNKEESLKAMRKKRLIKSFKGVPTIKLIAYFTREITEARRQQNSLKVLKKKNSQPRILYRSKNIFKMR